MKDETKRQKLAALLGISLDEMPPPPRYRETAADRSREADAVIGYIAKPQAFRKKECGQCGLVFATNQPSVSMCSDRCRVAHLAAKGIQWDPHKKQEERWGHILPLTVPPAALALLSEA